VGQGWGMTADGYGFPFGENQVFLKLDRGDSCTCLDIH
jgi:hypothetical protein